MRRRLLALIVVCMAFGAPAVRAQDAAEGDAPAAPPATAPADPADVAGEPAAADGGDADSPFAGLSFTSADDPITVEADRLEFDYEQNMLVYKGNVHVVQGDLELTSKLLTVTFDRADELERAQLNRVVAQGDVVIIQGERRATGNRAVFDQDSRQLILKGDPVLRDGPNEVQGDQLTVFLDEGRSVVESSPKKRVSAVLFPGQTTGEPSEGPPPEVVPPDASPAPSGSPAP